MSCAIPFNLSIVAQLNNAALFRMTLFHSEKMSADALNSNRLCLFTDEGKVVI
jgi:hypothetical protein